MARLSAKTRKAMPTSDFAGGGPKGAKGFPMNDATHQRLAISGATRSERAGNISASKAASIKAEARAKLKKGGGMTGGAHRSPAVGKKFLGDGEGNY